VTPCWRDPSDAVFLSGAPYILGLRLPKSVAAEAQVDEGDTVVVSVRNGAIVIRPSRPTYSLKELVARITPRNRHDESDWGTAVGDEAW
jgi:antitoxin MazE